MHETAEGGTGGHDLQAADGPEAISADASLSACREVGVARLVSFDHARALLPPGYEPGEAAEFLGMPTETGGGVVLTGQLDCADSALDGGPVAWGDLLVYVGPPKVAGVDPKPGIVDLYQIAHWSTGEGTLGLLEQTGFESIAADVVVSFAMGPELPIGSAVVSDASGVQVRFEVAGLVPQPYDLLARFWHETENGTAYFAHDRTPITMFMGTVITCEATEGSHFARAFGTTDCTGSESSAGVFAELSDFDSTYHYLPGVWAEPQ